MHAGGNSGDREKFSELFTAVISEEPLISNAISLWGRSVHAANWA